MRSKNSEEIPWPFFFDLHNSGQLHMSFFLQVDQTHSDATFEIPFYKLKNGKNLTELLHVTCKQVGMVWTMDTMRYYQEGSEFV